MAGKPDKGPVKVRIVVTGDHRRGIIAWNLGSLLKKCGVNVRFEQDGKLLPKKVLLPEQVEMTGLEATICAD